MVPQPVYCPIEPVVVDAAPAPVEYQIAPLVEKRFALHPYAAGSDGFFTTAPDGKPWLGKLQLELGDGSDEVGRSSIAFLLEGKSGLGIDFDLDGYTEELPDGGHDELHLGQINLTYRILEHDYALVRAGVGVGWLHDAYGTESGMNLTLQTDVLLAEDWVASADVDFGVLGDAETRHVAATVGRLFGPCEVYGGYDYRSIGDVSLHGPMVGLRLWW